MKAVLVLMAAMSIGGSLVAAPAHAQGLEPTPVCVSERQCQAMWVAAITEIEAATGMAVDRQNDSVIDTFMPGDRDRRGSMYGRVIKRPLPDGGYEMVAGLDCRYRSCRKLREPHLNEFNRRLSAVGRQFADSPRPIAQPLD